ncbi:hypothetical protein [Pseudomonas sp. Marseille-QA0892]
MHMFVSGLTERAAMCCLGHVDSTALQWQPSSLFLAEAELATDDQGHRWLWLYRAPWSQMAIGEEQDNAAMLHRWQVQQRAVLQLRRHLRQGLLLVNADRVAPQALVEHLGLIGAGCTSEPAVASPLSAVLAGVFERLAPECWELYEALEAASWLPQGTPEFRANREPAPAEALPELLDLLVKGQRLPALEAQLAGQASVLTDTRADLEQAERQLAEASAKQDEMSAALAAAEKQSQQHNQELQRLQQQLFSTQSEQQSVREENDLLLAQLHETQEELEGYYLANREILNTMGQCEQTLHRARRAIGQMASQHALNQGATA